MSIHRLAIAILATTVSLAANPSLATVKPQLSSTNKAILVATSVCTSSGGTVNIRSGPGKGYRVVGSLYSGAYVNSGRPRKGNDGVRWYPVSTGGVSGWVRGDYIC